jgi:hypothetical protein
LVIAAFGAQLALVLVFWQDSARFPHARGVDEVQMANLVAQFHRGQLAYFDPRHYPATFNPYGPLVPWLAAHAPAVIDPHIVTRLLSMGAFLCCFAMLAALLPSGRRLSLAGPALLLALSARPIFEFVHRSKVDAIAICFALAGFILTVYGRSARSGLAAAVAFTLAILTKTTFVAAPLAAVISLWPRRRGRVVAVVLGWWVLSAVAVLWLQHATAGGYLHNLRRPLTQPLKMLDVGTRLLTTAPLLLIWLRAAWLAADAETRRELRPWAIYAGLTYALGIVLAAAPGSGWNCLIECCMALALGGALLAARLDAGWLRASSGLLALHLCFAVPYLAITQNNIMWRQRPAQTAARLRAEAVLAPEIARGRRVAVLRNEPANDALVSLGQPTPLDVVDCMALSEPAERALAADLLARHEIDVIYRGRDLAPWDPTAPPGPPVVWQR